jgi:hypothetical protein
MIFFAYKQMYSLLFVLIGIWAAMYIIIIIIIFIFLPIEIWFQIIYKSQSCIKADK